MRPVDALLIAGAYLVGSLPAGYYLVRLRTGRDVRASGSGSAGAMNVGRELGRASFVLTLVADAAKGAVVAWAAVSWGSPWGSSLAVLAAVAGHIWPLHLGLRGGKGIATTLGALAVGDPLLVALLLAASGAFALFARSFTRGGLVAVALLPLAAGALQRPVHLQGLVGILAILLLIAHRENLRTWIRSRRKREVAPADHSVQPPPPASPSGGSIPARLPLHPTAEPSQELRSPPHPWTRSLLPPRMTP